MIEKLKGIAKEQGLELLESLKLTFGLDEETKARENISNELAVESFSNLLGYVGYDEASGLFIVDNNVEVKKVQEGYLSFSIEMNPQTGANDDMERVLQSLLMTVPKDSVVGVHLYADPNFLHPFKKLKEMRYQDFELGMDTTILDEQKNVYQVMLQNQVDYFLQGASSSLFGHEQNFLIRNFRLVVSVTTPLQFTNERDVEEATLIRDQVRSILKTAGFSGYDWRPDDLINFVADFLDHSRIFDSSNRVYKNYENFLPLRNQITGRNSEITVKQDRITIENSEDDEATSLISLSVSQYPTSSFKLPQMSDMIGGFFDTQLAYPCPFLISTISVTQDHDKMKDKAGLNTAAKVRATEGYFAKFDPLISTEAQEWKYALSAIDEGGTLVRTSTLVTLVTKEKDSARARANVMAIWKNSGFRLADDRYQQSVSFLASMPMNVSTDFQSDLKSGKRLSTKFSQNAVSLSPFVGEWKGSKTPTLNYAGRRGQLTSFDLFDNDAGNFNFAIVGGSGSGKTFFTQDILFSYRAVGAKVWVIDVGRGYENICKMADGEFIEFTEEANICINPFSNITELDKDMLMLKSVLAQMMSPNHPLNAWQMSKIEEAIYKVYAQFGKKMNITNLAEYFKDISHEESQDERFRDLGTMLFPYTREGIYGKYFDGEANITFQNDFTVLELEELKSKKELQTIVLMIMIYRITNEMYLTRDRKKIVLCDEAWSLFSHEATGEFLEEGYRRARRYGGAFGAATQSYSDFSKGGAKAALENADWTFTLRQKDVSLVEMKDKDILRYGTNGFVSRTINSLRNVGGKYSEIYAATPFGNSVIRFAADPFKQILFSSKAEHFSSVQKYKKQGLSLSEAVYSTMNDFNMKRIQHSPYGLNDKYFSKKELP